MLRADWNNIPSRLVFFIIKLRVVDIILLRMADSILILHLGVGEAIMNSILEDTLCVRK